MNVVSIDFEYKEYHNRKGFNVVCACTYDGKVARNYWLVENTDLATFKRDMRDYVDKGYLFNCHWAYAEVTSLLSLGINIDAWDFIDTYIEARLLQNSDKIFSKKLSLAELCKSFKIFDYFKDDYKDEMRRLILNNRTYDDIQRRNILDYCSIDARSSHKLLKVIIQGYEKVFKCNYDFEKAATRGNYVKASAHISWVGIPLDMDLLDSIKRNHRGIIGKFIESANEDVRACYVEKGLNYTFKADKFSETVNRLNLSKGWKLSDKSGKFSTEGSVLKDMRNRHDFINSLYKTQKSIQSLKYLKPNIEMERVLELQQKYGNEVSWENLIKSPKGLFNTKGQITKDKFLKLLESLNLKWEVLTTTGLRSVTTDAAYLFCFKNSNIKQIKDIFHDMVTIAACKIIKKNSLQLSGEDADKSGKDEKIYDIIRQGKIHIPLGTMLTVTGRCAPRAKYYPFAQSAWQRCLVEVPKGFKLVALDYVSAEVYIGAAFYNDKVMMEAYFSKDYYLYIGVMIGLVSGSDFDSLSPRELKDKYKTERKQLKTLALGLSYGMGMEKLALSLFNELPKNVATSKAKKLVSKYKKAFKVYFRGREQFIKNSTKATILNHWGHIGLERATTAGNFPMQASGAEILHNLVARIANHTYWDKGIYTIATLHDAIVVIIKDDNLLQDNIDLVVKQMKDACTAILPPVDQQIKVGYTITNYGDTFIEKDKESAQMVFDMLGKKPNFCDQDEIVV